MGFALLIRSARYSLGLRPVCSAVLAADRALEEFVLGGHRPHVMPVPDDRAVAAVGERSGRRLPPPGVIGHPGALLGAHVRPQVDFLQLMPDVTRLPDGHDRALGYD